ncbi:MAG: hypothetical protein Q8R78_01805 [Candidatus Omnitrophota bacterium]|nr:hypothetical protein [Candidatus Omnitrophota bacterium]
METASNSRVAWLQHPDRFYPFYLMFLYGAIIFYFFPWPIITLDTDLWYHLNSGRYIVEHRALPTDSSFISFLTPPRQWVDYYWLFQVLVYRLHAAFGYPGLITLRNLTYTILITVILSYFYFTRKRESTRSPVYFVALFVLYSLFLFSRYLNVRPHIFSYLLIAVFLLIYEYHPNRTIWLLPLAVLWCNLHGGEYPVMLLISGAYIAEYFVNRFRGKPEGVRTSRTFLIPAVLAMWAVLATPHGLKLLTVPFATAHASQYINEYQQLTFQDLATMHFSILMPSQRTLFNLLLAAGWMGAVVLGWRRKLRISHLLMLIGGSILLSKGNRFTYEFALLALPILATSDPVRGSNSTMMTSTLRGLFLWILLIVSPLMWLRLTFAHPPRFPISYRGLPQGVVTFLQHVRVPGSVLNFPNTGGYLQWALHPGHKIFMDMQCPLLFTEEDFYTAANMYTNQEVLGKVLAAYEPSFLSVPIIQSQFELVIRSVPDYVLVFFDDEEALYLNQRHYPTLAARYQLAALNPFSLQLNGVTSIIYSDDRQAYLIEARKLLAIYPDSLLLNQLVAASLNQEGAYDRALPFAEAIIRNFPESRTGYGLRGDVLQGLRVFDQALAAYQMALKRSSAGTRAEIFLAMGPAYHALGQHRKAYEAFKKGVNPFSSLATAEDLYWLGSSALLVGKEREGAMCLRFAAQKASPNDLVLYERLKELERFTRHVRGY